MTGQHNGRFGNMVLQASVLAMQSTIRECGKLWFSVHVSKNIFLSLLTPKLGLIPRIGSVENLCSEEDLDEYQKYHCIEIASEVGPHVLPEACARLIVSMSARIHNGAVGKEQPEQATVLDSTVFPWVCRICWLERSPPMVVQVCEVSQHVVCVWTCNVCPIEPWVHCKHFLVAWFSESFTPDELHGAVWQGLRQCLCVFWRALQSDAASPDGL